MEELDLTPMHQTAENLVMYREYADSELASGKEPLTYSEFIAFMNE